MILTTETFVNFELLTVIGRYNEFREQTQFDDNTLPLVSVQKVDTQTSPKTFARIKLRTKFNLNLVYVGFGI